MVVDFNQMILFMCRIAREHKPGCQAVLNVRFLGILPFIQDGQLSTPDLAEIYRTILYIARRYCLLFQTPLIITECTRPELQFRESKGEAISHLTNSVSSSQPSFIKALASWSPEDVKALVDIALDNPTPQ